MVAHMVLIMVAKLPLLRIFHLSPLLWPLNIYLPLVRHLPRVCITISEAYEELMLKMREMMANSHDEQPRTRLERALGLTLEVLAARCGSWSTSVDYAMSEATFSALYTLSY